MYVIRTNVRVYANMSDNFVRFAINALHIEICLCIVQPKKFLDSECNASVSPGFVLFFVNNYTDEEIWVGREVGRLSLTWSAKYLNTIVRDIYSHMCTFQFELRPCL